MKSIHLYGALKDKLGASLRLEVASAGEAIRAIVITRPEAETLLREGSFVLVRRNLDTEDGRFTIADLREAVEDVSYQLDVDMLSMMLGSSDLHIIPVVGGAGGRGIGKIILGVAMVAGAFLTAGSSALGQAAVAAGHSAMTATAVSFLGAHITFGALAFAGTMMALGGVSQMLAKAPSAASATKDDSYIFTGPTNTDAQSSPVPIVHGGPIRVGSVCISSAVSTVQGGSLSTAWSGVGGTLTDDIN